MPDIEITALPKYRLLGSEVSEMAEYKYPNPSCRNYSLVRQVNMTKAELIAKVAEKAGLKKAEAERAVNAAIEALTEALAKGERTAIPGLGVFNVKQRKARKGRDPKTGKEIKIPARKAVAFTASKSLKETVNKK